MTGRLAVSLTVLYYLGYSSFLNYSLLPAGLDI